MSHFYRQTFDRTGREHGRNLMTARVDKETCISCGICPQVCPDVFAFEDDGKAAAKVNPVPTHLEELCKQAASECPVNAIVIE
jgi:ferredoxin